MERARIGNTEKLKRCYSSLSTILSVLAIATVVLQIVTYERMRHLILCGIIIALCVVMIIFNRVLGDKRAVLTYGVWVLIWALNFGMNLLVNQ